jgi:hypothetical protein
MSAQIIDRTETGFTLQVTTPYSRSMLDFEETLQRRLNEAGALATLEGLRQFDTEALRSPSGRSSLPARVNSPRITRRLTA